MKIEFGVAVQYHFAGATPDHLHGARFATYDEADRYAENYRDECEPTIYVIVDDIYVFYCERSAVANEPYKIYHLAPYGEGHAEGQIETRIWWREFKKNPKKYLHLATAIL